MNIDAKQIDPFSLPSVKFEQRVELPAVSGIYFVTVGSEILYIGRSVNIQERWQNHHRTKQIETYDEVILAWFSFNGTGKRDLENLENACIDFFKPRFNDLAVEGNSSKQKTRQKYVSHTLGFDPSSELYQALLKDSRWSGIPISDLIPVRIADFYRDEYAKAVTSLEKCHGKKLTKSLLYSFL